MKIILTGGGTGGHIFPLIAVVRELKSLLLQKQIEQRENVFGEELPESAWPKRPFDIYYLGPKDEFGLILLAQEGVKVREISAGKIRRYLTFSSFGQNLLDVFWRVPWGICQSFVTLFFLAPDLVFSKGGYGSFPVVLAAWLLRIPIFLHDSDVDPGLVNKACAFFARKIFVSFPKTEKFPPSKMIFLGNPIRKEILRGSSPEAKELLRLAGGRPVVLIIGGSQGSQRINDLVLAILPSLLTDLEVIHQVGEKNFASFKAEADVTCPDELRSFYHPLPFLKEEEYKQSLAVADLVVSRASGGHISEIAASGKPSILIPLPEAAQGHQIKNAYAYAQNHAAVVMEENNLTPNFFLEKVRNLFLHPLELEKMRKGALAFGRPQAALDIAQYLFASLKM